MSISQNSDEQGQLKVNGSGVIQPISATSLPLPTGAALESSLSEVKDNTAILKGILDTGNSSTTPLLATGVFTGTWIDSLNVNQVTAFIRSDVAGTLDFQQSIDGVTIDRSTSFTISANVGTSISFSPKTQFFRIVFTNGASPQTIMRLQTILSGSMEGGSFLPIGSATSDSTTALVTKSAIVGKAPSGAYQSVSVTESGALQVGTITDLELDKGFAFASTLSRDSAGAPENVALFVVGAKPCKIAIYEIYFNAGGNTIWELRLSPTTTSDGTALTAIPLNGTNPQIATAALRDAPTVTATGTLYRSFITAAGDRVGRNDIVAILAPGTKVLLRRLNAGAGDEILLNVSWVEIT